jgi:hypothetical protein
LPRHLRVAVVRQHITLPDLDLGAVDHAAPRVGHHGGQSQVFALGA